MKQVGLKRLFLHAWKLDIMHPRTNTPLALIAPVPDDLNKVINNLETQQ
jgi:23S rRNA pseudouridine955/2504/2580 synthase